MAGIQRDRLFFGCTGLSTRLPTLRQLRLDRLRSLAKCLQALRRETGNLKARIFAFGDFITQLCHLMRQFLAIKRPKLLLELIQSTGL